MSPQIDKLMQAFCIAQGSMGKALKDSANPFHKSNYADLESVWDACKGTLQENGLSIMQTFHTMEGAPHIVTFVGHTSGQFMESELRLPFPYDVVDRSGQVTHKNDPQALGSVITYCRRYALAAMMGIVQTDDDCQSAMEPARKAEPAKAASPAKAATKQAQTKEKAKSESEDPVPVTPFDSPFAMLEEYLRMKGVDTQSINVFINGRASAKKTTPQKIIESALLSAEMTQKFCEVYSQWLQDSDHLALKAG